MNEPEQAIKPTEADVVAATREWGKIHGKTPEQMQSLTVEESGDCYRLAQAYTLMRLMRSINSEREENTA
jgi:hypothetical protein